MSLQLVSSLLVVLSYVLGISIADLSVCYECDLEPIGLCCFDDVACGDALCQESVTPSPTTTDTDTENTDTDTNETRDPGVCKYWSSASNYNQGSSTIIGGTPLDVCIGAFSGTELTSTSYIYTCSDDNSTVEYWWFTGSSDCNAATATQAINMQWAFDPLTDSFECRGDPCPHFIVMDGTAHPTQTCPYDTGKEYGSGADDYATWHEKAILQGCQSFDGSTSFALKCSDSGGVSKLSYNNAVCDSSGLIGEAQMLATATVECNYGTGRSVSCANGITSRNRHFAYYDPDPFIYDTTPSGTSPSASIYDTTQSGASPSASHAFGAANTVYETLLYVTAIFIYNVMN